MSRIVFAAVVLGSVVVFASAAQKERPKGPVFEGVIKDVKGVDNTLKLTMGKGKKAKDRTFDIKKARIVGLAGAEWKIDDLQEGDVVAIEMTTDGKIVQEVRVLKGVPRTKPVRPRRGR
jgi:hypothetical protein